MYFFSLEVSFCSWLIGVSYDIEYWVSELVTVVEEGFFIAWLWFFILNPFVP